MPDLSCLLPVAFAEGTLGASLHPLSGSFFLCHHQNIARCMSVVVIRGALKNHRQMHISTHCQL